MDKRKFTFGHFSEEEQTRLLDKYEKCILALKTQELTANELVHLMGPEAPQRPMTIVDTICRLYPLYETDDQPPRFKILTKEDCTC